MHAIAVRLVDPVADDPFVDERLVQREQILVQQGALPDLRAMARLDRLVEARVITDEALQNRLLRLVVIHDLPWPARICSKKHTAFERCLVAS